MESGEQRAQNARSRMFGFPMAVWIAFLAGTGGALCAELLGRRLGYPEPNWRTAGCIPLFAIPVAVGYTWRGDAWTRLGKRLWASLCCLWFGFAAVCALFGIRRGGDTAEGLVGLAAVVAFWSAGFAAGVALHTLRLRRQHTRMKE